MGSIPTRYKAEYETLLESVANLYIERVSTEQKANISYLKPLIKDLVALMFSLMEKKDVIKRLNNIRAQRIKGGKDTDIVYIVDLPDDGVSNLFKNFSKGL